jgi:hypothetical protein
VARTIVAVVKAAAENSDWRLLDTRLLFDAADHAARSATSLRPFYAARLAGSSRQESQPFRDSCSL